MTFADAHQLARGLGMDAAWNQPTSAVPYVYTTKAEPMSYSASAVLK
jgi:hypothetical protein